MRALRSKKSIGRSSLPAVSALHGFTKAANRRRNNILLERLKRFGYCMLDLPTFEELSMCDTADDQLFNKTVSNVSHVLHTILPPPSTASQHYDLRRRTHTLSLPEHATYLSDCNFITQMLQKHGYEVFISSFHVLLTYQSFVINVTQQLLLYSRYTDNTLFRQCIACIGLQSTPR